MNTKGHPDTPAPSTSKLPSFRRFLRRPESTDDSHDGSPASHLVLSSSTLPLSLELPADNEPRNPPRLRVNRRGRAPNVCKPHEAKVASQAGFERMIITSPNMDFVPQYPRPSSLIQTYTDGRWGTHEYTRWPQDLVRGMWHVACIPSQPSLPEHLGVLWETLAPDSHWREDKTLGFNGLGYITETTQIALCNAARAAMERVDCFYTQPEVRRYANFLVMILRQVVERMCHLPAVAGVAVAVAAHIQRVTLELAGLKTYTEIVVPRLESHLDHSDAVLPVLGAFVRDASDAHSLLRVGVPTWILQPLTHEMPVWCVVDCELLCRDMSNTTLHPPIFHQAKTVVGVASLTGNWQGSMVMTVSKHVSGTHLPALCEVPLLPTDGPPAKRARVDDGDISSKHLLMSVAAPTTAAKKKKRHGNRGKAGSTPRQDDAVPAGPKNGGTSDGVHPSKTVILSPFYELSSAWNEALRAVSPVARSPSSAVYFYPPPYLIDTITPDAPLAADCSHPERARQDPKVTRYLHNLVRIRQFCRARMFDPSLSSHPLTIAEWRASLWGDYAPKPEGRPSQVDGAGARRSQRRQHERNDVARLFGRVARLRPYRAEEVVEWNDWQVDIKTFRSDPGVRMELLWECHEINFRAELMALDTLMVQEPGWSEIHRWERESLVSTVWGPPSSVVSIIPGKEEHERAFRWGSTLASDDACTALRSLVMVISRWHGCPQAIVEASMSELPSGEDLARVQREAVRFYVRRFVEKFMRLPIPPVQRCVT